MRALTDTALKALKAADKTYQRADGEGLVIEVKAGSGSKSWMYRYRLNGKQEKLVIGSYPEVSLKEARERHFEARRTVARGESPARAKQEAKAGIAKAQTVKAFSEKFFREVVEPHRKDSTLPRRYLDKQILPAIGSKIVADVTVADVRDIIWGKKDQGFNAAAAIVRSLLKRLFDHAIVHGQAQVNPVMALPSRTVFQPRARQRNLSEAEIGAFLRAVNASNIRRQFKVALHIIQITMVRKSELLQARWADVNRDKGEWLIPVENSKTGNQHIVYLSRQAIALFDELKKLAGGSELVLPGRSSLKQPFAHNAINDALKVALKGEDIPAFTIHDLRRTASTHLNEQGFMPDVIEKALNHTAGGVRAVYNKAQYAEPRKQMLQAWADFVDSAVARPHATAREKAATCQ